MSIKSFCLVVFVMLSVFLAWGNYNLRHENDVLHQTQAADRQFRHDRGSDASRSIAQLSKDNYELKKQLALWESGINPADLKNISKPAARQSHSFSTGKDVRVAADHKPGEDEVIILDGAPEE